MHNKQLLLVLMLILASCVKRERLTSQDRLKIKVEQARLFDVPIPFGAEPVLDYVGGQSFGYRISEVVDLSQYYLTKMAQHGWDQVGYFDGIEQNLIFEKPHKLVSIIIRKQQKNSLVLILTSSK